MKILLFKRFILTLIVILVCGCGAKDTLGQTSSSVLYVPLIGLTSVPEPLALPKGAGIVTYHYAVKNFLREVALTDIQVIDDTCSQVAFVEGDDNHDAKLDYSETWRYTCTTKLFKTTRSTATAKGTAYGITATHRAYATVLVGSNNPPPLVSIVNITKVAYPLSLPREGGKITFTYKVSNPGVVSLSEVTVADDKCSAMSGKLGDTNGNNLLDIHEVWLYTCTTTLKQTTTNTVTVTAFANGLKAVDNATLTVKVDTPLSRTSPSFPNVGGDPDVKPSLKTTVWEILSVILAVLIVVFIVIRKTKPDKKR